VKTPPESTARWIFATRDRYRHVVEKIAKSSLLSEGEVALKAIGLARGAAAHKDDRQAGDDRWRHVGFYLIDKDCRSSNER